MFLARVHVIIFANILDSVQVLKPQGFESLHCPSAGNRVQGVKLFGSVLK
jgi:hypothetical protein